MKFSILRSQTDILIGGLHQNAYQNNQLKLLQTSIPYLTDDLVWCVKKAGNYPIYLNLLLLSTPEVWIIMVFGHTLTTSIIYYVFVQFDAKYTQRNRIDCPNAFWLIALPVFLGANMTFKPFYGPLRIFYGYMMISLTFFGQMMSFYVLRYIKDPISYTQIETVEEIISSDYYQLMGSYEVYNSIRYDERVNYSMHARKKI